MNEALRHRKGLNVARDNGLRPRPRSRGASPIAIDSASRVAAGARCLGPQDVFKRQIIPATCPDFPHIDGIDLFAHGQSFANGSQPTAVLGNTYTF